MAKKKCFPLSSCLFCGFRKTLRETLCICPGKQYLRTIIADDDKTDFPTWCPLTDCACPVAAMETIEKSG